MCRVAKEHTTKTCLFTLSLSAEDIFGAEPVPADTKQASPDRGGRETTPDLFAKVDIDSQMSLFSPTGKETKVRKKSCSTVRIHTHTYIHAYIHTYIDIYITTACFLECEAVVLSVLDVWSGLCHQISRNEAIIEAVFLLGGKNAKFCLRAFPRAKVGSVLALQTDG